MDAETISGHLVEEDWDAEIVLQEIATEEGRNSYDPGLVIMGQGRMILIAPMSKGRYRVNSEGGGEQVVDLERAIACIGSEGRDAP